MSRPVKERKVQEPPKIHGMKPMGVPARFLESVVLSLDEYEAIRLADYQGMDHQEAAEVMGVSRPTFTRLIEKARKTVAESIVGVKELLIEGGNFSFSTQLQHCVDCGDYERYQSPEKLVKNCPNCGSDNLVHLNKRFGGRHTRCGFGRDRGRN